MNKEAEIVSKDASQLANNSSHCLVAISFFSFSILIVYTFLGLTVILRRFRDFLLCTKKETNCVLFIR